MTAIKKSCGTVIYSKLLSWRDHFSKTHFFVNTLSSAQSLWAVHAAVTVWLATTFVVRVVQYRVRVSTLLLRIRPAWVALTNAFFILFIEAPNRVFGVFAFSILATLRDTLPGKGSDNQRRKGNENEQLHRGI